MDNLFIHTDKGTDILTGVGRIVTGDCLKGQNTDATGRPMVIKTGPNAGQPRTQFYIGLAIPKADPSWLKIQAAILGEAKHGFPQLFDPAGNCVAPSFAYKFTDGDSTVPNTKNVAPSTREGFPGHYVLHFSNGFAPKCFRRTPLGLEAVTDPNIIKRGYYVRIYGTVKGNNSQQNPGVFINTNMVLMEKVGEEIFAGPAAEEVFGGQDVFNTAPPAATMPPPVTTPPATIPPPVPAFPPAANYAQTTPPPVTTPPPAAAPPVTPPPGKMYNVNGAQCSHSQLIAGGWTEPQIAALP